MIKSVVRVLTSTLLGGAVLCAGSVALIGGCCDKCKSPCRTCEKPCDTCSSPSGRVIEKGEVHEESH